MKTTEESVMVTLALAVLLGVAGCSGMSERDKNTAIGVGVGAVGGAIITDGSTTGTIGGAAVGGIIGNQIGNDDN